VNRFQFVADHSPRYGVKRLCRVLGLARSSFYHWKATAPARAARAAADAALAARIRAVHTAFDGTYGVPRITAELRDPDSRYGGGIDGKPVNHKRVARVMRGIGLAGLRLRRRTRTTIPDPNAAKAPDLIGRDFTAPATNQRYVGDITYLPVGERGFLYLATVIDLHSRRLAGWAIADHMRTDLVLDALHAAQRTRGGLDGSIMHTDHGAQGEFNRSSQHLVIMEVFDGASSAVGGSGFATGDAFAGPADAGAACGARVLATDCAGQAHRGGSARVGRVDAGRGAVVSARWRHATTESGRAHRPLPVVLRA
jgi:integrase-like protein/helix-turn-helix protein